MGLTTNRAGARPQCDPSQHQAGVVISEYDLAIARLVWVDSVCFTQTDRARASVMSSPDGYALPVAACPGLKAVLSLLARSNV